MTPDFTTPCETCDGTGTERVPRGDYTKVTTCPDCDGLGLVPSNDATEAVADAIADLPYDTLELRNWGSESVADPYRIVARAAISALIEHTDDDEFGEPLDDPSRERIGDT